MTGFTDLHKSLIDILKHLTSLAVGTIVLMATFHEKIKGLVHVKWTLPAAIICLLLCIMYSLSTCFLTLEITKSITYMKLTTFGRHGKKQEEVRDEIMSLAERAARVDSLSSKHLIACSSLFTMGLILIGVFVVAN